MDDPPAAPAETTDDDDYCRGLIVAVHSGQPDWRRFAASQPGFFSSQDPERPTPSVRHPDAGRSTGDRP